MAGEGPGIAFVNKRFVDLGDVKQNDTIYHTVLITNKGTAPLSIFNIGKSCNCTDVKLDKTLIASGDTARMTISVSTFGKKGPNTIDVYFADNTEEGEHFVRLKMNCIE